MEPHVEEDCNKLIFVTMFNNCSNSWVSLVFSNPDMFLKTFLFTWFSFASCSRWLMMSST